MDWSAPVDLYCERLTPGLWAEPLNAASNLAFVVAGVWLFRHFSERPGATPLRGLALLIVLIGLCSGAFHIFATRWASALDVGSIALFIYGFVVGFVHLVIGVRWALAWLAAPAFWAFGLLVQAPFAPAAFNGSVPYFPALAGIALMGTGLAACQRPGAGLFGLATLVFLVSIALRSVDLALCPNWPWGTHWAWHLLNGLTLTCVTLGLGRASAR
jgi:hypothetical protein